MASKAKAKTKAASPSIPGMMLGEAAYNLDQALFGGPKRQRSTEPSPKRQAAAKAFKEATGRDPAKSMSIKAMNDRVGKIGMENARDKVKAATAIEITRPPAKSYPNIPASSPIGQALRGPKGAEVAKAVDNLRSSIDAVVAKNKPGISPIARAAADASAKSHVPTWTDKRPSVASPSATPNAPDPGLMPKLSGAYNTFNKVGAIAGTAVAAAKGFKDTKDAGGSTALAVGNAALAAAPGATMMAAKPVGQALATAGSATMSAGGHILSGSGLGDLLFLDGAIAMTGVGVGASGAVMKVAGEALKVAGKVAAPAMAVYGAYQGAKADTNKVRGAVRGAIGALDPTGIVTNIGAGTGMMTDARSLGERAFDAAFGKAKAPGQTATNFEKANQKFSAERNAKAAQAEADGVGGPKGWANPATQYAAQVARGVEHTSEWAAPGRR